MKVINVAFVFCVPPLTAFVIFTTYEFTVERLVASVAFTTLSLFNILRFPLVVLPKALRAVSGEGPWRASPCLSVGVGAMLTWGTLACPPCPAVPVVSRIRWPAGR